MRHRLTLAGLLLLAPLSSHGDAIIAMTMKGQPQQLVSDGKITSCGLRVLGVSATNTKEAQYVDFSVNLNAPGWGSVKAGYGGANAGSSILKNTQPKLQPAHITSFWLRAEGKLPTKPEGGKIIPAQSGERYLMYGIDLGAANELLTSIASGEPIQIGIKEARKDASHIFFGQVELTDQEKRQYFGCVKTWSDAILQAESTETVEK